MKTILSELSNLEEYNKIRQNIQTNKFPIIINGVLGSAKAHLICALVEQENRNIVILTSNELNAKRLHDDIKNFTDVNVRIYPSKDVFFYNADAYSFDIIEQRIEVMSMLSKGERGIVIMSSDALLDKMARKDIFTQYVKKITVGDTIKFDELIESLVYMGYERADIVDSKGEFAIRGGIIDIFPVAANNMIRIEFWDDDVDSIREVDFETQRSVEKLNSVEINPAKDILFDKSKFEKAIEALKKEKDEYLSSIKNIELLGLAKEKIGAMVNEIENNLKVQHSEKLINYLYSKDETVCILDYLMKDAIVFLDEPVKVKQKYEIESKSFQEVMKDKLSMGGILPSQVMIRYNIDEATEKLARCNIIQMSTLYDSAYEINDTEVITVKTKGIDTFSKNFKALEDNLNYYKQHGYKIMLYTKTTVSMNNIKEELGKAGFSISVMDDDTQNLEARVINITLGNLNTGFEYLDTKFIVLSEKDIFTDVDKKRLKRNRKIKGKKIESFTDLKVGDYIVHDQHGIGIYQGIEKIKVENVVKDYIKIEYRDGGNLYIGISQMDMIQKYIGSDGKMPKINKLDTVEWKNAKQKVKKSVEGLAQKLVQLYAERQKTKGYAFAKDNDWQDQFEDAFPYVETDDQLIAIEDIKKDMESERVMDRLICGDVGYGKTEVAIRAAFKAVQEGKQVAILGPTTILVEQHYKTFTERMKDFPIKIEHLSRFRTLKEQKESIKRIEQGLSDILIGTHRILSQDIKFRDLGLIIIDEEQRFGVLQKEKLKNLQTNVDVISLSATPIPRTLHMSLSGIRDMSLLEEAPRERQPIQTYVIEHDETMVRNAIYKEIGRGGQVYYLYNRVASIDQVTENLKTMMPEVNIVHAHGQMNKKELEAIMEDFVLGKVDVLVATSIIETGLDIPNVNTIVIHDADKMGLAQLYQLRGRVGRSSRIAYAYLLYKKDKVLREDAEKRLKAIKEFTELGSGFKIAMRDLEIRGAGNLLGAEQHGHMETVGYDMYCKILDESVRELKGEIIKPKSDIVIDININAFIPDSYIPNEMQKIEIYKKIAAIKSMEDRYEVEEEIEDRYGNIPEAVQNLIYIALMKSYAIKVGVASIIQKVGNIVIDFGDGAIFDMLKLVELIKKNSNKLSYTNIKKSYLTYKVDKSQKEQDFVKEISDIFTSIEVREE